MEYSEYLKLLIGLLAVLNPVGAVPLFLEFTADRTGAERGRIAGRTTISVVVILLVTLLAGEAILAFFGIGIPSFRVAGGLLIMSMAISMMHSRQSRVRATESEQKEGGEKDSPAIVPLAMPLLAGPGAMSTLIVWQAREPGALHYLGAAAVILVVGVILYPVLRAAPAVAALLGRTGMNIVSRVMGLILAAIGVEFIAGGVSQLLPGLAG